MAKVEVNLDKNSIKIKMNAVSEKGRFILSNELLKDANYYCRQDSGELIRSSIRESRPEEGELIWDTPYAKQMYYTGIPSADKNPNASLLWAQKAADQNKEKYERMLQKVIESEG